MLLTKEKSLDLYINSVNQRVRHTRHLRLDVEAISSRLRQLYSLPLEGDSFRLKPCRLLRGVTSFLSILETAKS